MDFKAKGHDLWGWALLMGLAFYAADTTCATAACHLASPPQAMVTTEPSPPKSGPVDSKAMVSLFTTSHDRPESQAASDQPSPSLSPAKAEFLLAATMADDRGRGIALVSVAGQSPEVFSTGQLVAGWELAAVSREAAELRQGDRVQRLEFMRPQQLEVPRSEAPSEPEVAAKAPPLSTDAEPIRFRSEIRDFLEGKHPEAQAYGSLRPSLRNGEVEGYRVRVKDPRFPLARLGLQDNDVVTAVNGVACTGPEGLSTIYRVLRNDLTLRLELVRQGQPESLTITLLE